MDPDSGNNYLQHQARHLWKKGWIETDPYLSGKEDLRTGLTLRVKPPSSVCEQLHEHLMKANLPDAVYCYPPGDMHITLLTLVSGRVGYHPDAGDIAIYVQALNPFFSTRSNIYFKMYQMKAVSNGFVLTGTSRLNALEFLRSKLSADLHQLPERLHPTPRYHLTQAHMTLGRFRDIPVRWHRLLNLMSRPSPVQYFVGSEVELVHNDWYHRTQYTTILAKFPLATQLITG